MGKARMNNRNLISKLPPAPLIKIFKRKKSIRVGFLCHRYRAFLLLSHELASEIRIFFFCDSKEDSSRGSCKKSQYICSLTQQKAETNDGILISELFLYRWPIYSKFS